MSVLTFTKLNPFDDQNQWYTWVYIPDNPGIPYTRCDLCSTDLSRGWAHGSDQHNRHFYCETHFVAVVEAAEEAGFQPSQLIEAQVNGIGFTIQSKSINATNISLGPQTIGRQEIHHHGEQREDMANINYQVSLTYQNEEGIYDLVTEFNNHADYGATISIVRNPRTGRLEIILMEK